MEIEEAVPKLTRSASDMLKKNLTGLVLAEILINFYIISPPDNNDKGKRKEEEGQDEVPSDHCQHKPPKLAQGFSWGLQCHDLENTAHLVDI